MKKALYTFIFGDYDDLKEPRVVTPGWDYICFSDQSPRGWTPRSVWKIRQSQLLADNDAKKRAMGHMILHHKVMRDYELTISVGGQIRVNCDLNDFVRKRFREDTELMLIRHPERACVYDEAEACKALNKDDPARIDKQMALYREQGLPPSLGLFATGVIGRRYWRRRLERMCDLWWVQVMKYSKRDQLALPWALWQHPVPISELGWWQTFGNSMGADRSFILEPHRPA